MATLSYLTTNYLTTSGASCCVPTTTLTLLHQQIGEVLGLGGDGYKGHEAVEDAAFVQLQGMEGGKAGGFGLECLRRGEMVEAEVAARVGMEVATVDGMGHNAHVEAEVHLHTGVQAVGALFETNHHVDA